MNKKKLLIILLILFLILVFYSLLSTKVPKNSYYNLDDFELLKANIINIRKKNNYIVSQVMINDSICFYDKSDDEYLFSIKSYDKMSAKIEVLSVVDVSVAVNQTSEILDFSNGKNIELLVYSDKYYSIVSINFTTLPIVGVRTNYKLNNVGDDTIGLFILSDPYFLNHGQVTQDTYSFSSLKLHGHDSLRYDKKSYSLKLLKETNNHFSNNNISLLGMYNDDSWVLDAMYIDRSKIRNKLSSDLWNLINDSSLLKSNYVELFIDDSYMGLYNLKEKLNTKSLNISNDGVILKSLLFLNDNDSSINFIDDKTYEVKYAPDSSSLNKVTQKLENYYNHLGSGVDTDQIIKNMFDIENIVAYKVFITLIKGVDNDEYNNYYYSVTSANAKIKKNPWDMDLTFGLTFNNIYEYSNYDQLGIEPFYSNSPMINKKIVEKYFELRNNYFTMELINSYIDNYQSLIVDSGAYIRDGKKWYYYDAVEEINNIRVWCDNRIGYLDEFFNQYPRS